MSNDIIIEAWNTVLFKKFTRFRHLFVEGYSRYSDKYLATHPYQPGTTVLDVGCGWGDTTIKIAASLGPKSSRSQNRPATTASATSRTSRTTKRTNWLG